MLKTIERLDDFFLKQKEKQMWDESKLIDFSELGEDIIQTTRIVSKGHTKRALCPSVKVSFFGRAYMHVGLYVQYGLSHSTRS